MDFDSFINPVEETTTEELEIFRENSIDFDTGEQVMKNGNLVKLEKNEALKVWIWKALKTKRNTYSAYSTSYGNDLKKEIGYIYDRTVKEQLLYNEIIKCLLVNPYISNVSNFSTEKTISGEEVTIYFDVETIYGGLTSSTGVVI